MQIISPWKEKKWSYHLMTIQLFISVFILLLEVFRLQALNHCQVVDDDLWDRSFCITWIQKLMCWINWNVLPHHGTIWKAQSSQNSSQSASLGGMNVCTKCHDNPSNRCLDLSVKITNENLLVELVVFSNHGCLLCLSLKNNVQSYPVHVEVFSENHQSL